MFLIIQSNDTKKLAYHLTQAYKQHSGDIFDEFVVIVPAKVLEEWLKKTIAKQLGISSLFTTKFWGQYQWQLIGRVLDYDAKYLLAQNNPNLPRPLKVPETALLSASVIRWRLFAYLADDELLKHIVENENHPLYAILSPLFDEQKFDEQNTIAMAQLWRFCDSLAKLYVGYLTERTDWLDKWANGIAVDVDALIAQKDKISQIYSDKAYLDRQGDAQKQSSTTPASPVGQIQEETKISNQETDTNANDLTPEWLVLYYKNLEQALRFLWKTQFASVYRHRTRLEQRFWQVLEDENHPAFGQKNSLLPNPLYLFTVQQLPQIELDFLQRLSLHTDIVLFHFNPSVAYWADIKDKNWLKTQQIINADKVQFLDYGHTLLSRLGKSARETLAMLVDMSVGDNEPIWKDVFDETLANTSPSTLLDYVKADILQLQESSFLDFVLSPDDDSLVIHNCHSLKRQLEIARVLIGKWLNQNDKNGNQRHLSDVAVMLPDVQSHYDLIRSVFGEGVGVDGLYLPAKITGVADESTHKLWSAILGVYQLPAGRLYADEFFEWLMNPYVYEAFGLNFEQALRGESLLRQAGFVRGLDEYHLKQTLHAKDTDFRRTLAFAIDRLSLSLTIGVGAVSDVLYPFVWQSNPNQVIEKTQTLACVNLDDTDIIQALCRAYLAIVSVRADYEQKNSIEYWLKAIEDRVINRYFYLFRDSQNLKSVFDTMNAMKASVRANSSYHYHKQTHKDEICLPLKFVLDALSDGILAQQIAAEPSGVISFGRFGSLRGIGFGLVLMLGMNLSEFPRSEPVNRLDLKKAGLPRRGDRISEDDDNGAFLEAMLQASENCWIFYDGQSSDGKKQLPASPVGELLAFLKGLDWDFDQIETQVYKKHTPTPFHQDNFEKPPIGVVSPPLWQNVYQAMAGSRQSLPNAIWLPNKQQVDEWVLLLKKEKPTISGKMELAKIANALKKPAKTFLSDKLYLANELSQDLNEPLAMNSLVNYELNQLIINDDKTLNELIYDTKLPAGISRQTLLDEKKQDVQHIIELYYKQLDDYGISYQPIQVADELIRLENNGDDSEVILQTKLAKDCPIWHILKVQSFTKDKLIECYLLHLCWQIHLGQTTLDNYNDNLKKHSSFYFFCKDKEKSTSVIFQPIIKKDAIQELSRWLSFYELIKDNPICLTPKNALLYLENEQKQENERKLLEKLFEDWLKEPYDEEQIFDDNCYHRYWQIILGNHSPIDALTTVLPIANIVYKGLFFNSKIIINQA